MEEFVLRVDAVLKEKGLTRQIVADACGFRYGNFSKWKHGDNRPLAETVLSIAQYLNVSVEWLLTGKDPSDLTEDERHLVSMYRRSDERGKKSILETAKRESCYYDNDEDFSASIAADSAS